MPAEDHHTAEMRRKLEDLLRDNLQVFDHNKVTSTARCVYLYLNPLSTKEELEQAQQKRAHVNSIGRQTLVKLADTLTPIDPKDLEAYHRIVLALIPVFRHIAMGDVDAEMMIKVKQQTENLKKRQCDIYDILQEVYDPILPEISEITPLVRDSWKLVEEEAHSAQMITTTTMVLHGFIHHYLESYKNIEKVTESVIKLHQREAQKLRKAGDDDALDVTFDFIQALDMPITENWTYLQKRDYLTRLYTHLREGASVEQVSRWASDVSFGATQETITFAETYNLADKLLALLGTFPEREIETLRQNMRSALQLGCMYQEALDYVAVLDELKDQPKKQALTVETFKYIMGNLHLPYAITSQIAEGARMKPESTTRQEMIEWMGTTLYAIVRGCSYEISQVFFDTLAVRIKEEKTFPDDDEKQWQHIFAQGMGMYKQTLKDAMAFADDYLRIHHFWDDKTIHFWHDTITFALVRGMPYETAKLFFGKTMQRAGHKNYAQLWNWQRLAAQYVTKGVSIDDAATRADADLADIEPHAYGQIPDIIQDIIIDDGSNGGESL
ncbi:hypothetical protein HY488_00340 [Candidatus Woesearchaeota archaeon]|nr:hypothetical protein [Candidatus Woesearchaeota archaeon]